MKVKVKRVDSFKARSGEAEGLFFQNMADEGCLVGYKLTVHFKLRMLTMVDLVFGFSC